MACGVHFIGCPSNAWQKSGSSIVFSSISFSPSADSPPGVAFHLDSASCSSIEKEASHSLPRVTYPLYFSVVLSECKYCFFFMVASFRSVARLEDSPTDFFLPTFRLGRAPLVVEVVVVALVGQ